MTVSVAELFTAAREGDRGALARLVSIVERGGDDGRVAEALAFGNAGGAWVVGLTGAPGAGKSSLVAAMVGRLREAGDRVAVLAVDPSSPVSGGAVLGDRVRMQGHAVDPDVFVRSMASRGVKGGLAAAAPGAVRVFDAAGFPWVLVETVGVGQAEVDVAMIASTTVVVVSPGWGDGVQAEKAGLLEVADVLVVNKADRPGADEARTVLTRMLDLTPAVNASLATSPPGPAGPGSEGWRPPVVATTAKTGEGIADLLAAIADHRAWLAVGDRTQARRRASLAAELRWIVTTRAGASGASGLRGPRFEAVVDDMVSGRLDPSSAADILRSASS